MEQGRGAVKCRGLGRLGDERTVQSVKTLTFKSPWFHLEHIAYREDERRESKIGEGRRNETLKTFSYKRE